MRIYPIFTCREMIRHYQDLSTNTERTERVRQLAAVSLIEWQARLEAAAAGA